MRIIELVIEEERITASTLEKQALTAEKESGVSALSLLTGWGAHQDQINAIPAVVYRNSFHFSAFLLNAFGVLLLVASFFGITDAVLQAYQKSGRKTPEAAQDYAAAPDTRNALQSRSAEPKQDSNSQTGNDGAVADENTQESELKQIGSNQELPVSLTRRYDVRDVLIASFR